MQKLSRVVRGIALAGALAVLIGFGFVTRAQAGLFSLTLTLPGTGTNTGSACWLNYTVNTSNKLNTWVAIVGVDSAGQPIDVDYFLVGIGASSFSDFLDISGGGAINTAAAGVVTAQAYSLVGTPPAAHLTSPDTAASYAYAIGGIPLSGGSASIDPGPILGSCGPASDGRINPQPGATVAIYCNPDGGFDIYGIDRTTGQGYLAIRMTAEEIADVPANPPSNLLVREFGDIRLYRLTTGEWQVNRGPDFEGKTYVYIWRECAPGGHEASFTQTNPPAPLTAVGEVVAAIGQAVRSVVTQVFAAQ